MTIEQAYKRWRAITTVKNNIDKLDDDYLFLKSLNNIIIEYVNAKYKENLE